MSEIKEPRIRICSAKKIQFETNRGGVSCQSSVFSVSFQLSVNDIWMVAGTREVGDQVVNEQIVVLENFGFYPFRRLIGGTSKFRFPFGRLISRLQPSEGFRVKWRGVRINLRKGHPQVGPGVRFSSFSFIMTRGGKITTALKCSFASNIGCFSCIRGAFEFISSHYFKRIMRGHFLPTRFLAFKNPASRKKPGWGSLGVAVVTSRIWG